MADPVTIGIALAVASAAQGAMAYSDARQQSKTTQKNAQLAYDNQVKQERAASIDQMNKAGREALQAQGSARVSGAESGISVSSLLQDLSMQNSQNLATINQNYENRVEAAGIKAQGQMNQAPRPNAYAAILNTGIDATKSYYAGKGAASK